MKTLEELKKEHHHSNSPAAIKTGYFDHIFKVKKPTSAAQLEKLISEFVDKSGGVATKVSVMGREVHQETDTKFFGAAATVKKSSYIPSSTAKGTSDLIIGYEGRALYCEVKFSKSDRLSQDQISFRDKVKRAKCAYIVVTSLDDFYKQWEKFTSNV